MGKTAIISGATGFLGRRVCAKLASSGHKVVGLSRTPKQHANPQGVEFCGVGEDELERAFSSSDGIVAVIHIATNYGRGGASLSEIREANVVFPSLLLKLAMKYGAECFMNADTALPGITDYARTKREFADFARKACYGKLLFFNLPLQRMYGPGEGKDGFAAWLISRLLSGETEIGLTAGEQVCDFAYVDDVADAFAMLLENRGQFPKGFLEVEVGTGSPVSVRHFAEEAKRLCGSGSALAFGKMPYREGEPMHLSSNASLLRSLGWKPKVGLEDGLKMTIGAIRRGDVG